MSNTKVIGGEYEINTNICKSGVYNQFGGGDFYASGRAALFHIIRSIITNQPAINNVLIPDYICDSVVETLNDAEIKWTVYHLNQNLTINRKEFENVDFNTSVILLVNYFGLSNQAPEIAYIRSLNENAYIIEDNVQSCYSMFQESDSDYRFTSFRKSLPLPDGGWVLSKHPMVKAKESENTFTQYKVAGSILKSMRKNGYYGDEVYLHLLEQGEELINNNYTTSISRFTKDSLPQIDINRLASIRCRNAEYLIKQLDVLGIRPIMPVEENHIPLFLPIRLENRNKIRRAMFAENIYCPVHWPFTEKFTDDFVLGKQLAQEELSLIVDYRYTITDIKRIIQVIKENL